MSSFDPGRDREGLKQALIQLMEESWAFRRVESRLDSASDATREKLLLDLPERALSPAYYLLGDYLIWLASCLEAVGASLPDATAFEANGLAILGGARNKFESDHPPCWSCGERQESKLDLQCWNCGAEFKRKS